MSDPNTEFERYFTERGYRYGPSEKQNARGWYKAGHELAAAELATLRAEVARLNRLGHERDGNFLDPIGCCKVCDGEIPDGHMDNCDIWKLEAALAAAQKDADNWRKLWCENSARLSQPTEQATAQDPQTQSSAPAKP